jgi:hypothetical protein
VPEKPLELLPTELVPLEVLEPLWVELPELLLVELLELELELLLVELELELLFEAQSTVVTTVVPPLLPFPFTMQAANVPSMTTDDAVRIRRAIEHSLWIPSDSKGGR